MNGPMVDTLEEMLRTALEHQAAGRLGQAEALCRSILQAEPHIAATEHLLGQIALHAGHVEAAMRRFAKAVALAPEVAAYHHGKGVAEDRLGRKTDAVASFRQALPLHRHALEQAPRDEALLFGYAVALFHAEGPKDAIPVFRRLLTIAPNHIDALDNLALALMDLGRLDEAIALLQRALALAPDGANSHNNLALALLAKGDYAAGWAHHERGRPPAQPGSCPAWQGEPLNGARILLHAEQGYGDTLQFVRYAPLVAARGGQVVLQVQPALARLMTGLPGVAQIVTPGTDMRGVAFHCPLMSLPHLFGTQLDTIPWAGPYLTAPPDRTHWDQHIPPSTRSRVGLVWQGQTQHRRDSDRSAPAEAFSALARIPDLLFYSLQTPRRPPPPGLPLIDLADGLQDFGDTAAAIRRLDLVITVDTSIAHLAGAMAKPVWVLLAHTPDWRWLEEGADSPWYPTARLFRQQRPGDWSGVMREVVDALVPYGQAKLHHG